MSLKAPFKLVIDADKCSKCLRCIRICPNLALILEEGDIRVLEWRCTGCMACAKSCPASAISFELEEGIITVKDIGDKYEWHVELRKNLVLKFDAPKQLPKK